MRQIYSPLDGFRSPFGRLMGSTAPFTPAVLFGASEPGVWYDPSDVANLAWRRNLLTFTEQFDNAAWTKVSLTVTANGSAAPDGTATGDRIIESNDGSTVTTHSITSAVSLTAGLQYVFSFYAKGASSGRHVWVGGGGIGGAAEYPIFNVTGGSVDLAATTTIVKSATISAPDANGWRRCSVTFVPTAATAPGIGLTASATDNASVGYIGNGTSGVDIWGAQLELGSVATDYQKITDVNTEVIERFPSATLYQDTAGTTPVTTPGQTVALALDKSKGLVLGSELVSNPGNPFVSTTGYSAGGLATISVDTGRLRVAQTTGFTDGVLCAMPNNSFANSAVITFNVDLGTSSLVQVQAGNGAFGNGGSLTVNITASGTYSLVTTTRITGGAGLTFKAGSAATFFLSRVSVKELPGFHATQATLASRPTYGIVPLGGRRNLLTRTEEFNDAAWLKLSGGTGSIPVVTANSGAAPTGTLTADRVVFNRGAGTASGDTSTLFQSYSGTVSPLGINSVWMKSFDGVSTFSVVLKNGFAAATVTVTGTWQRFSLVSANATVNFQVLLQGDTTQQTADILVWGAQGEAGSSATAYQRVGSAFDVTEASVASLSYLSFDGVDDFLITPTITPGIDKAQVFAGVRHLSNANYGALTSFGTTVGDQGTFLTWLRSSGGGGQFEAYARGSSGVASGNVTGTAALTVPATSVFSTLYDIAQSSVTDEIRVRQNGAAMSVTGVNSAGTGNFSAWTMNIGQYNGSNRFNGNLFSLIVRFGTNLDAGTITSTETWVNGKTGAYA